MWLLARRASSPKVTTVRLLWGPAQAAYPPRLSFSQVSPIDTWQLCMSLHRSGTTTATEGSLLKSVGKSLYRRLLDAGTLLKFTQGLCLRAYRPEVQPVYPAEGMLSEYPAKVRPAAMSWCPRFSEEYVCGHESSVIPCVDPENSAR